jgi:WD40 repeat protein
MLASGSEDKTVKLWDTASGELIRTLDGHAGPVSAIRFDPQGRYLVAAGSAGRLQFWDYPRGVPFLYLESFGPGAWLALLPDGRFDGTPEALRYLCYTRRNSFESFTAEEVLDTFYKPQAVQEVLAKYNVPLPSPVTA